MQLVLNNGTRFQLMPYGEVGKDASGDREFIAIPDMWAIPGGAVRSTDQVIRWADDNGAKLA